MLDHSSAKRIKVTRLVQNIITDHFGNKKIEISMLSGGLTNHVFAAKTGNENLVIRFSEESKSFSFIKEQWAVSKAREIGVPVPDILEVGTDEFGNTYMISHRVKGESAIDHPERNRIIEEMGRLSKVIHNIKTTGYGEVYDWSANVLSKNKTFPDYLNRELRVNERIQFFQEHKMIPPKILAKLKGEVKEMFEMKGGPVLHHGDLRLKNMMVDEDCRISAIIDWENSISSIPPYWDLSIALHDLTIDEQVYFLKGYGLNSKRMSAIANKVKVLNILNYAPVLKRRIKKSSRKQIDESKIRLSGMLDLFTL